MCIFHVPFISVILIYSSDDDPIGGSKLVPLYNNKSPFVVSEGFVYMYFAHTTGWPLLSNMFSELHKNKTKGV
jgi:hypothetical protein